MQVVTGQYPNKARLHKMFPQKYHTATCPWCQLTQCTRFREARTEAHNRCWRAITRKLVEMLPTDWQFYHDTPMSATGLLGPLDETSTTLRAMSGAAKRQGGRSTTNLLRLRPDAVAVNRALKNIAMLAHCRPHDTVDRGPPDPPQDSPVTLDSEKEASGTGNAEAEVVKLESGAAD
jgi:hypothetical protein